MCLAYIPPSDSQYLATLGVDILEEIHKGISKYSKVGHTMLIGDFNARTGSEPDFVIDDSDHELPLQLNYLTDTQIPLRNSLDSTLNTRGKEILDICISAH